MAGTTRVRQPGAAERSGKGPRPSAAPAAPGRSGTREVRRLPVVSVAALLERQQSLTAVDKFSRHDGPSADAGQGVYRDLIPLERPRAGEQYSFEVDLDACTGCKACVAACHSLNGLDTDEVFRVTGLLRNHAPGGAALKTVTSSCHHCLDPACLTGCPVAAYEKDPVTGIVRHLDDQCFGCQYCTLMCPYDAPKYNPQKGIVRKCDMCSDRLEHGQAPACVESCPSSAIRIRNVSRQEIGMRAAQGFLPGVADPAQTQPTTQYVARAGLHAFEPIDALRAEAQHAPLSLILLLTFTQLAAGLALVSSCTGSARPLASSLAVAACATLGMLSGLFHLGRPWLAFRAVVGLRSSWLSREAVVLGLFAAIAGAAAAHGALAPVAAVDLLLTSASAVAGLLGVFCSVMVYAATRRAHWSALRTGVRFFGGTLLLGAAASLALQLPIERAHGNSTCWLASAVLGIALLRLANTALAAPAGKRASAGMSRERALPDSLGTLSRARGAGLIAGGVLAPLPLLIQGRAGALAVGMSLVCLLLSELCDRHLFFSAAPPSRMPGGLR